MRRALLAAALVLPAAGCARKELRAPAPSREIASVPSGGARSRPRAPRVAWMRESGAIQPRFLGSGAYAAGRFYAIGGTNATQRQGTRSVESYDPVAGSWREETPEPSASVQARTAVVGGTIFVLGGCLNSDCGFPTNANWAYDTATRVWTRRAPMPTARYSMQVGVIDGKIYAAGGDAANSRSLSMLEVYDPETDLWTTKAPLPAPRGFGAAGVVGGKLFVTSGSDNPAGRPLHQRTETFVYDPATDAWSSAAPMPAALAAVGSATLDGKIFVLGGLPPGGTFTDSSTTVYIYDPAADSWKTGPRLNDRRYYPLAAAGGGKVFVAGLYSADADLDSFEALAAGPRAAWTVVATARVRARLRARPGEALASGVDALPPAVAPRPHSYAVVVGVEHYREKLPRADFSASDASLTAKYFERVLGVPRENLVLLTDEHATRGDFTKYFERWLPNRVEKGDTVFVYYSGHGAPNPSKGDAYLVPYDGDPTYIEQTGYSIARLYAALAKLPAERVFVAMDSCFSGAGGRSVIAKGVRPLVSVVADAVPARVTVLAASASNQVSNTYEEKGHGLFTYFLLEGLREKGGDLRAAFDYLKPRVERTARREYNSDQEPQWEAGR